MNVLPLPLSQNATCRLYIEVIKLKGTSAPIRNAAMVASFAALTSVFFAPPAGAADLPPCFSFGDANTTFEGYGPTDVNVQAGNGRLTVNENKAGTITLYKYPNPSLYNQVKYMALRRDEDGKVENRYPNEGSFVGIWYEANGQAHFAWLRDWDVSQRYNSNDTPVPVTTYRSPSDLGLTVTATDLVTPAPLDSLVRRFSIDRRSDSPVTSARLVYYENFNPIASHLPLAPVLDWCFPHLTDQQASYDSNSHSIVHSWHGLDAATLRFTSVAHAFGWDGPDYQHQVGTDHYENLLPFQPADGYREAGAPPYSLSGNNWAIGQVTGTLSTTLSFDGAGHAEARLTIASGPDHNSAVNTLNQSRGTSFNLQMDSVASDWRSWLVGTKLPASNSRRVVNVAKRSLITARLATDAESGSIVASSNTQSPYGEDWIRDGAYINEMLDMNGHHEMVTDHNLFYKRVQTTADNPSFLRDVGNWPMNSYASGVDGGPIPYEIDETGLGIWTLARHYKYLGPTQGRNYLRDVYPSIILAADYLTRCEDHVNHLQCWAWEDDHIVPSQTLSGASAVYLGLKSALMAARVMRDNSRRVALWRARFYRLRSAIDTLYDTENSAYRQSPSDEDAAKVDYGTGGSFLWPVAFRRYSDPRMQGEADKVREAMYASLTSDLGSYEAKPLLGLAYAWSPLSSAKKRMLNSVLRYMAGRLTTDTGLFGETWKRFNGRPFAGQAQPHVWAHTLFYLAAVKINGSQPYTFDR